MKIIFNKNNYILNAVTLFSHAISPLILILYMIFNGIKKCKLMQILTMAPTISYSIFMILTKNNEYYILDFNINNKLFYSAKSIKNLITISKTKHIYFYIYSSQLYFGEILTFIYMAAFFISGIILGLSKYNNKINDKNNLYNNIGLVEYPWFLCIIIGIPYFYMLYMQGYDVSSMSRKMYDYGPLSVINIGIFEGILIYMMSVSGIYIGILFVNLSKISLNFGGENGGYLKSGSNQGTAKSEDRNQGTP